MLSTVWQKVKPLKTVDRVLCGLTRMIRALCAAVRATYEIPFTFVVLVKCQMQMHQNTQDTGRCCMLTLIYRKRHFKT